jgi:hypothetical protein
MIVKQKNNFCTIEYKYYSIHFLTVWEAIAHLSNINLLTQKN